MNHKIIVDKNQRTTRNHAMKNPRSHKKSKAKFLAVFIIFMVIIALITVISLFIINSLTPKQMTKEEILAKFYGPESAIPANEIPDVSKYVASIDDLQFDNSRPIYVLFHGYGQDEQSLIDLIKKIAPEGENAQWIALRAPFEIDKTVYGIEGNSWYFPAVPDNPGEGSEHLVQNVAKKVSQFLIDKLNPNHNIIPIGFSQGGLMASELVRSSPDIFAGAVSLSGQVDQSDFGIIDDKSELQLSNTPIFYASSDVDDIIPTDYYKIGSEKLRGIVKLTDKQYNGIGHSINNLEFDDIKTFLSNVKVGKSLSVVINGDLLFHPGLWNQYKSGNDFDFTELFAGISPYLKSVDIAICDMETPIAPDSGPYYGYPVFSIPPTVIDYAAKAGWNACTTSTNHAIDNGVSGIERMIDRLDRNKIYHTGSYKNEVDANTPLEIQTPLGKLALIGCTVSLNGSVADVDWRVDRCRDDTTNFEQDTLKMINKAKTARTNGSNVVIAQLHSVQEYIDYADSWELKTAHTLADSGQFDLIYAHGSHSVQPVEFYNGVWIIYGVGNVVTESAPAERSVNNDGITYRITFDNLQNNPNTVNNIIRKWNISDIAWVASANAQNAKNKWCSLASDHPQGVCRNSTADENSRNRISKVIHSMLDIDYPIFHEWIITK